MRLFTLPTGEIESDEAINMLLGPPFDLDLTDVCVVITDTLARNEDQIIDIAKGVLCVLQNANLGPVPTEIRRVYDLNYKLNEMEQDGIYVDVVLRSDEEEESGSNRGNVGSRTTILVAVNSNVAARATDTVDQLIGLSGQIRNLFRRGRFNGLLCRTRCSVATALQIYNQESMDNWQQFTSLIELTFITQ